MSRRISDVFVRSLDECSWVLAMFVYAIVDERWDLAGSIIVLAKCGWVLANPGSRMWMRSSQVWTRYGRVRMRSSWVWIRSPAKCGMWMRSTLKRGWDPAALGGVLARVFDFRLYIFFASKRNEANRDPFRMRFACSLRSCRFLFFAIFTYFRIKSFFVFALFRFINFLFNINCWIRLFSYIICTIFLECGTLRAMKN